MKRNVNKVLSFMLSMLIVLSCFSTGIVAFAAEQDAEELTTELATAPVPETEQSVEDTTEAPEETPEKTPEKKPGIQANPEVQKQLEEAFAGLSQAVNGVLSSGMQFVADVQNTQNAPRGKEAIDNFLAAMDQVTEPYDNADIALVKPLYEKLSYFDKKKLSQEIKDKYAAIMAAVGPNVPGKEQPDLSVYTESAVAYPKNVSREQVERALPKLEGFVNSTINMAAGKDLQTLISEGLYTNQTVLDLCKAIYPAITNAVPFLKLPPSVLADSLTEEKFAGAVQALKAAGNDWNAVVIASGDFGFQDGDKDGFLDAASAIFRPLAIVTLFLPFENQADPKNGTYIYGIYEDLIPIFEMLDAEGVLSSPDYTAEVLRRANGDSNAAMDARIRLILDPVFSLVDRFAEKPVDTVLTVLPKLAYLIDSGILNTQVDKILARLQKLVPSLKVDLSTKGLYAMIAPSLQEIDLNGIKLSFLQDEAAFTSFITEMSGCGEAAVKDSVESDNIYRLGINADTCDSFVVLFSLLYNEIASPANIASLRAAVDANTSLSTLERFTAEQILRQLERTTADKAMAIFVNIVSPNPPKFTLLGMLQKIIQKLFTDIGAIAPDLGGIFDSIFGGGSNGGDDTITDAPDIPMTGAQRVGAVLGLALTVAVASGAGFVIYKKRKEDK